MKPPAPSEGDTTLYRALDRGLGFETTMGNVLTLTPPLITTREDMERALGILDACLGEVEQAQRVFRYSDRAWRQRRLFRRLREEGACSKHVTDERKWLRRREPARRRENT